ncbi:putative mitochondrial protein [Tanacetum coccineum]
MAPGTRSLASTSTDDVVDDRIKRYVEDALVDIQRGMEAMLTQIANGGGNRQQTQYSRMTKVEFLKFSGDDVRGWIFRCEQFFLIDTIPEDQKRFRTVFDDPMAEIKNVKYTSNAKEYQDKFDDLLSMVEVSVEHSVSLYLGGLPTELEIGVRMFRPQTLAYAYRLTNLQEATLNALKKNNKMKFGNSGSKCGSNGNTTNTTTKPLLAFLNTARSWNIKPSTNPPRKQLSQKEYEEKRSKNLCFYYDKKYVPGYNCEDENLDEIETEEVQPQISLNALSGVSSYQTLRVVRLFVNGQEFHVLIDSSSTHNFLDTKMAKRLGCAIRPACPLTVNVAGEKQLLSWLSNLGDIKRNFKDLIMEFVYNNKKMVLRGTHKTRVQWAEGKGQLHKIGGTPQAEMFMLCVYPNTGLNMLVSGEQRNEKVLEPELTQVVEKFSDVFEVPRELPPKRNHDHRIPLIPGTPHVNIRPYRHLPIQKDAIEAMVKELLESGVIKPSQSHFSSPIVMVKKKDNTWKMCVDYGQLNKSTIKDKFHIPIIDKLIDELHGAVVFSKLDLRSGYHQIRMFEDDIAKTAFRTHEGHYEFFVMPFRLTNAPSIFQALMNDVFKDYLRKFVLVFFDDILIYSKSISEHVEHLATILTTMRQNKLFSKKTKCVFGTSQVEYLGHVIFTQGVATNPSKIVAMKNWPTPMNIKQLRGFFGLTGYYRKFIKSFASLSKPLTQLLKKGAFKWSKEAHNSFKTLKLAMTQAPVLALLDFTKLFVVETDAYVVGIRAVLQQNGHPIAYLSKALAPKHQTLLTYEKEFLAVMMALEKWKGYLLDTHFIIKTDHYSLKYLLDQRITTPAQMKWLPKLIGYDYEVKYKKGVDNAAADALSRVQNEGQLMASMVVTVPTALFTKITVS